MLWITLDLGEQHEGYFMTIWRLQNFTFLTSSWSPRITCPFIRTGVSQILIDIHFTMFPKWLRWAEKKYPNQRTWSLVLPHILWFDFDGQWMSDSNKDQRKKNFVAVIVKLPVLVLSNTHWLCPQISGQWPGESYCEPHSRAQCVCIHPVSHSPLRRKEALSHSISDLSCSSSTTTQPSWLEHSAGETALISSGLNMFSTLTAVC